MRVLRKHFWIALAAILLVTASLAVWHWRFVEVPDGIIETALSDPLTGWTAKSHNQFKIVDGKQGPLLRLERNSRSEKTPSIHAWFKPKANVSAIHIRCESRWKDVRAGKEGYTIARIVSMMKDQQGKVMHPPDFGITWGTGSRGWHHSEAVLMVTPDMADLGLEISMLGDHGLLEVSDLIVTGVRNRPWIPAATAALLSGWTALFFLMIRRRGKSIRAWRALSAATVVVIAGWILVFPQPKGLLHPVIGSFSIAEANHTEPSASPPIPEPAAPVPPPTPPTAKTDPAPKTPPAETVPAKATESPDPQAPKIKPPPELKPANRTSNVFYKFLRATDRILPVAHLGLYTFITLVILTLTGDRKQWPLPLALAILSELVPELTDHLGGWDDWTDVLQNIAGVGLALFLWSKFRIPRTCVKNATSR